MTAQNSEQSGTSVSDFELLVLCTSNWGSAKKANCGMGTKTRAKHALVLVLVLSMLLLYASSLLNGLSSACSPTNSEVGVLVANISVDWRTGKPVLSPCTNVPDNNTPAAISGFSTSGSLLMRYELPRLRRTAPGSRSPTPAKGGSTVGGMAITAVPCRKPRYATDAPTTTEAKTTTEIILVNGCVIKLSNRANLERTTRRPMI